MERLLLLAAIAVWGSVHSWLASLLAKRQIAGIVGGRRMRAYRLAYNAFSVVSFVPILWLMTVLPDRVLYSVAAPWRYLMIAAEMLAGLLLLVAMLQTDALHFAGLRQIIEGESLPRLVTTGFYRWVRHPLYLFGLLFLWLTPIMTANTLVLLASLTLYILAGMVFEERRLTAQYGQAYVDYRARTAMLVPGLRFRRQGGRSPRDASES